MSAGMRKFEAHQEGSQRLRISPKAMLRCTRAGFQVEVGVGSIAL